MQEEKSMTPRYFCTLFDSNYLLKGLAMIRSLERYCPGMKIHVLCMDDQTQHILDQLDMPFVDCIALKEIETEELLKAKADRGVAEYCWTLSSCFTWYVMQNYQDIDFLTYVDADLLFYSDVQPLFSEIGDASIAIIEHRFSPRLQDRAVNGRFCVEWDSFRRDEQGLACLTRWRNQCIEWCYYRLEDGKMGDQKYLDEWPGRFSNCHILMHPGAGIAPWNYSQYHFSVDDDGNITVNGTKLVFYHFHQFQILSPGRYDRLSSFYTADCPEPSRIYEIYERCIEECMRDVLKIEPNFTAGIKSPSKVRLRRLIQTWVPLSLKELVRKWLRS
jgi:hypothetical protein